MLKTSNGSFRVILLLSFSFLQLSVQKSNVDRIIGGRVATRNQFPCFGQLFVTVRVTETQEGVRVCGSTLIHPQWILSAAHCLSNNSKAYVSMGTNKMNSSEGVTRSIVEVHLHPDYVLEKAPNGSVTKLLHDICVAKLNRKYEFTNFIQSVQLAMEMSSLCKAGKIVGIGMVNYVPIQFGRYVRYGELHTKRQEELGNPNLINPSKNLFFSEVAMGESGYAAKGDSGGPFLCYFGDVVVQYGVISLSADDTVRGTVQIAYEAQSGYMDFILKYVPDLRIYENRKRRPKGPIYVTSCATKITFNNLLGFFLKPLLLALDNVRIL